MTRDQWINTRLKLLLEGTYMAEDTARMYLNEICDLAEKDGIDYDEMVFCAWLKLSYFVKQHCKKEELEELYSINK